MKHNLILRSAFKLEARREQHEHLKTGQKGWTTAQSEKNLGLRVWFPAPPYRLLLTQGMTVR